MTMVLPAASQRQAALLVHALPSADREWLLGSLEPHDRVEMEGLLDELRELDIPPDSALLEKIVEAAPPRAARTSTIELLERLPASRIPVLVELLRSEPPRLVSTLLGMRAWPWKGEVARALGRVEASAATHPVALQQALCEAVWRRLQAKGVTQPAAGPRWNPLARWKAILR